MLESGGGEALEGAETEMLLAERLLNDLALDGDAEGSVDGVGGLGEDGEVGGAAAATDGAAAAVEHGETDAVLLGHFHKILLRLWIQNGCTWVSFHKEKSKMSIFHRNV